MSIFILLCLIVATLAFAVAIRVDKIGKVSLVPLGLCLFVLAQLVPLLVRLS